MKRFYGTLLLVLVLAGWTGGSHAQVIPGGQYFGQSPPGFSPEIFAPGIVSLDNRFEYCLIFSPDLTECVFGVTNPSWSVFNLWYTKMDSDSSWIDPIPAPFQGDGDGLLATYAADGNSIDFVSMRPSYPPSNIWRVDRDGGGWSEPVLLDPPINTDSDEWGPTLARDGTLYFCSFRAGGLGEGDLYRAVTTADREIVVESLGATINSAQNDASPYVDRDERYIIFESDRPGGYGQSDLYISYNESGVWSEPMNLGPEINTEQIEDGPFISRDGRFMFFNRRESWYTAQQTEIWWIDARAVIDSAYTAVEGYEGMLHGAGRLSSAPNPFSPKTRILYSVPSTDHVAVTVHDILGREIRRIVDMVQPAGTYAIPFEPLPTEEVASGVYYCTLRVGSGEIVRMKMVLLR